MQKASAEKVKTKNSPKLPRSDKEAAFADSAGISKSTTDQLYRTACTLYQENKYAEAATLFILLTTLNPYAFDYWLGLGLAEQHNKQFETAIFAYDMASWTDDNNPAPYIHSADCYLSLKGKQLAHEALEKAISRAGKKEEYRSLKEEALKKKQGLN